MNQKQMLELAVQGMRSYLAPYVTDMGSGENDVYVEINPERISQNPFASRKRVMEIVEYYGASYEIHSQTDKFFSITVYVG